jgi:hypothetical protein
LVLIGGMGDGPKLEASRRRAAQTLRRAAWWLEVFDDADPTPDTESRISSPSTIQSHVTDAARHRQFLPNSHRQQHRLLFIVIEQHQTVLFDNIVTR